MNAQLYNKEFAGKIYVKQDSEFFTFTATAENLTPTDVNLDMIFQFLNRTIIITLQKITSPIFSF